jgi:hypothetical protein
MNKFQEVEGLFSRAEEHLNWLREYVVHPDPDRLATNSGYYIAPESGDIFTAKVRIVIGEFASCLRNALNYLTCAVAEQDSGVWSNTNQFPLESSVKGFEGNRSRFLQRVSDEHVRFFERFQPYNIGRPFERLRDFSNAYRHRELIRVEKQFQNTELPKPPPQTYRLPAGHEVRMNYFVTAISLADGNRVVQALEEIEGGVRQAVIGFRQPLERYIRLSGITF